MDAILEHFDPRCRVEVFAAINVLEVGELEFYVIGLTRFDEFVNNFLVLVPISIEFDLEISSTNSQPLISL